MAKKTINHQERKKRVGRIEKEILEKLTLGDLVYGMLLSNHSTRRLHRLAHERAMDRYRRKKAVERLVKLDFIRIHGRRLSITNLGKRTLGSVVLENAALLGKATWDRKWRIAIFDIPQEYASLRDRVRGVLKKGGCLTLQ